MQPRQSSKSTVTVIMANVMAAAAPMTFANTITQRKGIEPAECKFFVF